MESAYFLHYAAHSDFEQGIFVPYASPEEALLQAASDLMENDPGFIEGIFQAEYNEPKFGWTRTQLSLNPDDLHPHLDPEKRKKIHSRSEVVKASVGLQKKLVEDQVKAREEEMLAIHQAIKDGSAFKNTVPGNAYVVMTGGTATAGAAALSAATAKTLVLISASTANPPSVVEIGISFDGVSATAVPVLVELCSGTAGGAGTSTSQTPKQLRGWPSASSQTTGAQTFTAEPTTELVNRKWLVSPNGGLFVVQFPLGREPTGLVTSATDAKTWSVRATAPATVNAHAYIEFEE